MFWRVAPRVDWDLDRQFRRKIRSRKLPEYMPKLACEVSEAIERVPLSLVEYFARRVPDDAHVLGLLVKHPAASRKQRIKALAKLVEWPAEPGRLYSLIGVADRPDLVQDEEIMALLRQAFEGDRWLQRVLASSEYAQPLVRAECLALLAEDDFSSAEFHFSMWGPRLHRLPPAVVMRLLASRSRDFRAHVLTRLAESRPRPGAARFVS